jgi:predicted Zn-dependent protease
LGEAPKPPFWRLKPSVRGNMYKSESQIALRHATMVRVWMVCTAAAAFVPFNMGGCASSNDIGNVAGSIVGSATHDSSLGSRTGQQVTAGVNTAKAMSIDERAEKAMGESVVLAMTNKYKLSTNEKLNHYVSLVGQTVVGSSTAPDLEWVFGVLDTDDVNAFAGPGGFVLVTRGAIARMDDEAELAGVLAHEVAHVTQHHGLEAVKNSGKMKGLTELAAASVDQRAAQFMPLASEAVDTVAVKGYDRGQEFRADEEAVRLLVAAGYDPNSYARFLAKLQSKGGLMSTHPGAAERAQRVASQIHREVAATAKGATLRERLQANVK